MTLLIERLVDVERERKKDLFLLTFSGRVVQGYSQ